MGEVEGVGIDVEEIGAFDRFDHLTIMRASRRWLSPLEQVWCGRQPCLPRAMVVVFSCREAAFKSVRGVRPAHELALRMQGDLSGGHGALYHGGRRIEIEVTWSVAEGRVLALAVAGDPRPQGGL